MATMNSSILHTSRSFCSQISYATSHPLPPLNSLCLNPCSFIPPRLSIKFSGFQSVYSKTNSKRNHFIIYSVKKLSEVELVQIAEKTDQSSGKFPSDSGVYAVYDKNEELQFIGISRSISASILNHQKSLPDLCYAAKVGIVDEPDRATLTEAWKSWMEEHIGETGVIPPGNQSDNQTWVRRTQKKPDLRLTPGRHVQLTVPLEDLIDLLVKENKIVAFIKGSRSAPQCGFSQKVVGILENEGVDFECVNVLDEEYNYGLRETLKRYSSWPTFPQIFVKGELIGGCDVLSSMAENGELSKVFKD